MDKIDGYKRFLGFHNCQHNISGKLWCFSRDNLHGITISNDEQQLTINLKTGRNDFGIFVTAIYAEYTSVERKDLWESLNNLNSCIDGPLCIGVTSWILKRN